MKFLVTGVDKETGEDKQEIISADTQDDAQNLAYAKGIMVSSVKLKSGWQAIYLMPRALKISAVVFIFLLMVISYFIGREHIKYEIQHADDAQKMVYSLELLKGIDPLGWLDFLSLVKDYLRDNDDPEEPPQRDKRRVAERPQPVITQNTNFRNIKWGMTPEQVLAAEQANGKPDRQDNIILYQVRVGRFDCTLVYIFVQNRLVRANYIMTQPHSHSTNHITDYKEVAGYLNQEYGQATEDKTIWLTDLWKDDPRRWGLAIQTGTLHFFSKWQARSTDITLLLAGDNYECELRLEYVSQRFKHLVEKENKQKIRQHL